MSHEIDCWTRWLLHTRFRGSHGRETLDFLAGIRDRVLDRARLQPGEFVLDVGSGDGLLAFGALPRVASDGMVIVDDVSQDLIETCARLAQEAGVTDRVQFVRNSATDLCDVPDASVDAVLTRSVLIYVADKARAALEFRRVLRPGGRISICEPITQYGPGEPRFGIDPGPIADLAGRVDAAFRLLQPPAAAAMLDFDERVLLRIFERAGFSHLDLELHVSVRCEQRDAAWFDAILDQPGNPRIPTLRHAIAQALSPGEAATYLTYYRRALATSPVITRQALAYLYGSFDA